MAAGSAPTLELESLLVRVIGDASSFTVMAVDLDKAVNAIEARLVAFASKVGAVGTAALTPLSRALNNIGNFLMAVSSAKLGRIPQVVKPIEDMVNSLKTVDASGLDELLSTLGKVRLFVRGAAGLDVGAAGKGVLAMTNLIGNMVRSLASLPFEAVDKLSILGRAMTALANVRHLAAVDVGRAGIAFQAMGGWFAQLGSISPEALKNVSKLGTAMRGFAAALNAANNAAVPLPPIISNVSNNLTTATRTGGGFVNRLREIGAAAMGASGRLSVLNLTAGGFAAFGVHQFAVVDDGLTKVLAHMRDWNQANRPALEAGLAQVASNSITPTQELVKALDALVGSGMNAAMAVKALTIAEEFGVAAGMEVGDATRKLTTLQRALGMESMDVETNFANMRRLSDLMVGMAPKAGTTTEKLMEAFGPHFAATVRNANVNVEDAVAILALYSGQGLEATQASDAATRSIEMLALNAVKLRSRFEGLGVEVFNADGSLRNFQGIVDVLQTKLGGLSVEGQFAELALLGLEKRSIDAILPLVNMGDEFRRLREETEKVGGVSKLTADMIRNDLLGSVKTLWNNVKLVAMEFGRTLAPAIVWLNDHLRILMKHFLEMHPVVRQVLVIALVLGPALAAIGTVASFTVVPAVTALFTGFTSLFGALSSVVLFVGALSGPALLLGLVALLGVLQMIWMFSGSEVISDALGGVTAWMKSFSWDKFVGGGRAALEAVGGFFYNFQENVASIFDWLHANWVTILTDMAKASGVFAANLTFNFAHAIKSLVEMWLTFAIWWGRNIKEVLLTVGDALATFFRPVLTALGALLNIFVEQINTSMASIGPKFANSFIDSLNRLGDKLALSADNPIVKAAFPFLMKGQGVKAFGDIAHIEEPGAVQQGVMEKRMTAITDTMSAALTKAFSEMPAVRNEAKWKELRDDMSGLLDVFLRGFRGPLEGFVPILKELPKLNLALPDAAVKTAEAGWTKMMKRIMGGEPSEGLNMMGPRGPGFGFKQMSLNRFEISGGTAQTLDYQQLSVLRFMSSQLTNIEAATRENKPAPAVGR